MIRVLVLSDSGGIWKTSMHPTTDAYGDVVGSWIESIQLARDAILYVNGDAQPGPRRMINWNATQLVRDHVPGWTGRIVGTAIATGIDAHGRPRHVPDRYGTSIAAIDPNNGEEVQPYRGKHR